MARNNSWPYAGTYGKDHRENRKFFFGFLSSGEGCQEQKTRKIDYVVSRAELTERLYKGPRQMKTEFRVRPIRIFPSLKNAQNRSPRVMDSRPQNRRFSEFFAVFAFFSFFLIKKNFLRYTYHTRSRVSYEK